MDGEATEGDLRYNLRCQNSEAASGVAKLVIEAERFTGALEVKMGGKNMTFTQRIEGKRTGACEIAARP